QQLQKTSEALELPACTDTFPLEALLLLGGSSKQQIQLPLSLFPATAAQMFNPLRAETPQLLQISIKPAGTRNTANAFARNHPLLSSTREAAHRLNSPSIGWWMDQMKAGNRDKHRLIATRQERLWTG
ncbi:hypothetical protein KUCAC02_003800, partial [Chaenocephalus aceratus]